MKLSTIEAKKIIIASFKKEGCSYSTMDESEKDAILFAVKDAYEKGGDEILEDDTIVNIGGDYVDSTDASVESQKTEILRDMFRNCTVKELEALELLIRNKKPEYNFTAGRAVPHPDNINAGDLLPLSTPLSAGFAIVRGYSAPVAVEEEIGDAVHGAFVRI